MAYTKAGRFGPKFIDGCGFPGREAAVYLTGTATLATLYTSSAKSVTAANPTVLDANGLLSFYAEPGTYTVRIAGNRRDVQVDPDPSEVDTSDAAGTHLPVARLASPNAFTLRYDLLRSA